MTWLILALFACGGAETPPEPAPAEAPEPHGEPAPEPKTEQESFTSTMKLHFELATEARNAVIQGNLDQVHTSAKQLAELDPPTVPDPWKPHINAMKERAKKVADTQDLDAAGVAVAELAATCGACHELTGGGPKADLDKANKETEAPADRDGHMKQHLWAADRMWLGLVGPDRALFDSAAKSLATSELHDKAHGKTEGVPESFATLEKQIHELADAATGSGDAAEQAKLYGHFLANCAACHGMMGIKPAVE